ncbi:MAG: GNAT family N-acetyltransferase [Candidatus Methylomirabilia bacterium]
MKVEALDRFELVGEKTWNGFLEQSAAPVPFLTWQWQSLWWKAFGHGRALSILQVADSTGRPVGVLPLYEHTPGAWQLVGGVDVSDYLDLLAVRGHEEASWAALLHYRAADSDAWDLHCLRAASLTVSLLPRLAPAAGLSARIRREERCPVLALPDSWDGLLERLPGKDRHELKRKIRRLERQWPEARVRSHASPAGLQEAMTTFLALHRKSGAGKRRFMDQRMEEFFREVASSLVAKGWLRLWFLERDEAPVAAFLCLEFAGSVALYNSGFDPARAAFSPGIVLLCHVIRDAIDRRFARVDFLRGEERYKYAFGPVPEDLFNVVVAR